MDVATSVEVDGDGPVGVLVNGMGTTVGARDDDVEPQAVFAADPADGFVAVLVAVLAVGARIKNAGPGGDGLGAAETEWADWWLGVGDAAEGGDSCSGVTFDAAGGSGHGPVILDRGVGAGHGLCAPSCRYPQLPFMTTRLEELILHFYFSFWAGSHEV